jgi:hypothetical protein
MGWLGLFDIRTLACCYRSSNVRFERLVGQPSLIGKVRVARHSQNLSPASPVARAPSLLITSRGARAIMCQVNGTGR